MISDHLPHRRNGRLVRVLIVVVFGPSLAWAAKPDRFYVAPDGQKLGLIESKTEYGVTLRAPREAGAIAKRLELTGQGNLETLPGPAGKFHLLRVPKTSIAGRDAVRKDSAIADLRPVYRFEGSDSPLIATGEILVRVQAGLSEARRQQLWSDYRVEAVEPFDGLPDVYVLGPFSLDVDEVLVAEALADDQRTVWAQPNFRRETRDAQVSPPADPLFAQQWHLQNIKAPEAWTVTQGQGIIFGMRDDSCDVDHPDLVGNWLGRGQDVTIPVLTPGFDDPRPKELDDEHGTAVMGLAVARPNSVGVRGVAPLSKFAPSRAPFGFGATDRETAGSYIFALGHDADVHINSWGYSVDFFPPQILMDAIQRVFNNARHRADVNDDGENEPLGMVVLFASGNDNRELHAGLALASMPEVIAVGATDGNDRRAGFSNFGEPVDIMAPGVGIVTTDNRDSNIEPGYNIGGVDDFFGLPEIEPTGNYTKNFGGTSAACPIAAGVAGLVLAVNPRLTATDVRLILEHTADQVLPAEALYDPVTSRSFFYGYGRVNANRAVQEAQRSLNDGLTWPDPPEAYVFRNDPYYGSGIFFFQNVGATDVLVVQSDEAFEFVPQEKVCYDAVQPGCGSEGLGQLPPGVDIRAVGCGFSCDIPEAGIVGTPDPCRYGGWNCVFFEPDEVPKYFGIYARHQDTRRYSFGVEITPTDDANNSGQLAGQGFTGGGDDVPLIRERPPTSEHGPALSVNVAPLRGRSPLTVRFIGNAVGVNAIDESKTAWDFDINDDIAVDVRTRQAVHTYTVDGVSKTFVARFSMTDINGNESSQEVAIFVEADADAGEEPIGSGLLRIVIGLPGTPGSNVVSGKAPFNVLLSVDASGLPGTLRSITWDLGDGSNASALTVPHTYYNDGTTDLRLPVTATVESVTPSGVIVTTTATREITIQPGQRPQDSDDPQLPGTGAQGPGGQASPCGVMGMIPLMFCLMSLVYLRKFGD